LSNFSGHVILLKIIDKASLIRWGYIEVLLSEV